MKTLTTGDVARICEVAPRTASKWIDTGRLPGYRIPGSEHRRVRRVDLDEFLRKYNMPPVDDSADSLPEHD